MHRTIAAALTLGAVLSATPAAAQMQWEGRGFVDVGLGVQATSRDFRVVAQPEIYEEPATISADQSVGSGVLFDIAGGYRVWRNLLVGIGYSRFGDSSTSTITASIPHPLEFDAHRTATADAGDLDHTEHAVHFVATWMIPVTDKIEVGLFGGPSIFSVRQDIVSDVGFTEGPSPFTSITLGAPTVSTVKESGAGINVGAQVTYLVSPRFGVNGFLRYAGTSVNIPEIEERDLNLGGLHLGVGLRVRF